MPLEKGGLASTPPAPDLVPPPCPQPPPPRPPSHHTGLAPFAPPPVHPITADAPLSLPGSDSTEHDARGGRGLASSPPASHDPRAHSPPPLPPPCPAPTPSTLTLGYPLRRAADVRVDPLVPAHTFLSGLSVAEGAPTGHARLPPGRHQPGHPRGKFRGNTRPRARTHHSIRVSIAAREHDSHACSRDSGERSTRISHPRPRPSCGGSGPRRRDPRHLG